jgi:hypothetical protein
MMIETDSVGTSIFSEVSGSAFESEAELMHFNHLFSCSEFACRLTGLRAERTLIRRWCISGFAVHAAASY